MWIEVKLYTALVLYICMFKPIGKEGRNVGERGRRKEGKERLLHHAYSMWTGHGC